VKPVLQIIAVMARTTYKEVMEKLAQGARVEGHRVWIIRNMDLLTRNSTCTRRAGQLSTL
jgi:hypothetical protein